MQSQEWRLSPDFPPCAFPIRSCKLPQIIIKLCKEQQPAETSSAWLLRACQGCWGSEGRDTQFILRRFFFALFVVFFVVVCEMPGRKSTMNRKCSKETRLLHGIAQPAPSVPTTELCMGVWDTHGNSILLAGGLPSPRNSQSRERPENQSLSGPGWGFPSSQHKCRCKGVESRIFLHNLGL